MTRKLNRNYSLSVVVPFIAILTLLIAAAVLAQTSGAGQPNGRANAPLAPAGTAASAQAERPPIPWTDGAGNSPASRSHTKRHDARPMDSNPLFLSAVAYSSGGGMPGPYRGVAVADVNGDGKPDIVVANNMGFSNANTVGVLLGNGDGTFQSAVTYNTGGQAPTGIAIADVNGDGKPDLVVVNGVGPGVGVLLGNGDGTFQPAVTYGPGGWGPIDVAVADVNRDGKPDLVVANVCFSHAICEVGGAYGAVGVLLGNGDGTFQPAVEYGIGEGPSSVAVADVNGDGKPDIVVANSGSGNVNGSVSVLLGNGDGTFHAAVTYGTDMLWAQSIAVGDVNGDNKPDLVVANSGSGNVNGSVSVLLGNGDGTFQAAVAYDSGGGYAFAVAIADVDGDGKPDLVVTNAGSATVSVLLGNGDGTFQPAVTYGSGGNSPFSIVAADVNGDGSPDLVVANQIINPYYPVGGVGVLLNNTGPHTPTTTTLASSLNPSVYTQAVTFNAEVSSTAGVPAGKVVFSDGSIALGSATLVNGSASISVSSLAGGTHSMTAAYLGLGSALNPSTSAPLNQVVNPETTTTSLTSSQNPAVVTELVTYTATIARQYGGAVTGAVMFQDGASTVATVTVVGNQPVYTTKYKVAGVHAITATYSGDTSNTGSVSATVVEQINKGFTSKTALTTSGSPSFVAQPVTFTATVTSTHGTIPDGDLVTFLDNTTAIGTSATASGVATFVTSSLAAKTHTIKAAYDGDATFEPSIGSVKQIVDKNPTTTALSSSPNPSAHGQAVTFTATVASAGPTPTGKVEFKDGTTLLGSATMSGGVATLTKSKLAVGTHPITAEYLGDAANNKSTSAVLDQVVQ